MNKKIFIMFLVIVASMFIFAFRAYAPVAEDEYKKVPITMIAEFEIKVKNGKYELIETVAFDISRENPSILYSGVNEDSGVVFSFAELTGPVYFSVYIPEEEKELRINKGAFTNDTAVLVDLGPGFDYEFQYGLAPEEDKDLGHIDTLQGKLHIYKVLQQN